MQTFRRLVDIVNSPLFFDLKPLQYHFLYTTYAEAGFLRLDLNPLTSQAYFN